MLHFSTVAPGQGGELCWSHSLPYTAVPTLLLPRLATQLPSALPYGYYTWLTLGRLAEAFHSCSLCRSLRVGQR